ncbi:MAG: PIF1 family ATP-dependent DNA helicase [archaeon]|nr:PIF1 family ATP-dependent DNA helicase [archaeon]
MSRKRSQREVLSKEWQPTLFDLAADSQATRQRTSSSSAAPSASTTPASNPPSFEARLGSTGGFRSASHSPSAPSLPPVYISLDSSEDEESSPLATPQAVASSCVKSVGSSNAQTVESSSRLVAPLIQRGFSRNHLLAQASQLMQGSLVTRPATSSSTSFSSSPSPSSAPKVVTTRQPSSLTGGKVANSKEETIQIDSAVEGGVKQSSAEPARGSHPFASQPSMAQHGLSEEQNRIFKQAMKGESFFLSGSAGVGKSFLLVRIIEALKSIHHDKVAVTASTGVAALNIKGSTVHSWAGIGLGTDPVERLLLKLRSSSATRERWENVRTLVIDEISMLPPNIFTLLDNIARRMRKSEEPFGGIQVILCGDFLQLPPVETSRPSALTVFAFHSEAWKRCVRKEYILRTVFRQKNPEFVQMLQEIRVGRPTASTLEALKSRILPPAPQLPGVPKKLHQGDLEPIRLFCDNAKVNMLNMQRLDRLPFAKVAFEAKESGSEQHLKQLDSACLAPKQLVIKRGAQVMLLKNLSFDLHLVNGSQGVVVGYTKDAKMPFWTPSPDAIFQAPFDPAVLTMPVVQFTSGTFALTPQSWEIKSPGSDRVLAYRSQVPLRLAWAVTIHKSQGLTLQSVEVDLSNCFACGQMYTALSRVSSMEGLCITGWRDASIRADPAAIEYYDDLEAKLERADRRRK